LETLKVKNVDMWNLPQLTTCVKTWLRTYSFTVEYRNTTST